MIAWAPKDDLWRELDRSRAIRVQPGLTRPEDPREFGRRAARESFERYVQSRKSTAGTDKR